jgi:hypothetical protein
LYTPVDSNAGALGGSGASLTFIPAEHKQPIDIARASVEDLLSSGRPMNAALMQSDEKGLDCQRLSALFHKFGNIFRTEVVGQASCLSFLDRQARCLSHQYNGLKSSLILSSRRMRYPNCELDQLVSVIALVRETDGFFIGTQAFSWQSLE